MALSIKFAKNRRLRDTTLSVTHARVHICKEGTLFVLLCSLGLGCSYHSRRQTARYADTNYRSLCLFGRYFYGHVDSLLPL
jgi:hypothetical protein